LTLQILAINVAQQCSMWNPPYICNVFRLGLTRYKRYWISNNSLSMKIQQKPKI
jgi:hypothetical protein